MHRAPIALALALPLAAPAAAQDRAPEPADIVSLRWGGLARWLASPKDAGLRRALSMLEARLAELPEEVDDDDMPPQVPRLLGELLAGRLSLRLGTTASEQAGGLPFYLRLELAGETHSGSELAGLLRGVLEHEDMELPDPDADGRTPLPLPVPAWFGGAGDALVVALGEDAGPARTAPLSGLPAGGGEVFQMRFDYQALGRGIEAVAAMTGADPEEMSVMLELYTATAKAVEWQVVRDASRTTMVNVTEGFGQGGAMQRMLSKEPLSLTALEVVPPDAWWGIVMAYDLLGLAGYYRELLAKVSELESTTPDPYALPNLGELLGIEDFELERDVLAHLGPALGAFAGDTTGGRGLLATVMFADVADAPAFARSLARLEGELERVLAEKSKGYARLRRSESQGVRTTTLLFPGLPVPLEPTWTVAGGRLFLGGSAAAVEGAVSSALRGGGGLLANERFRAQLGELPRELRGVGFVDVPRYLPDAYGRAHLGAMALANLVRSPKDPARDPGSAVPPLPELLDGAQALAATWALEGPDLVNVVRADPSALVNGLATTTVLFDLYAFPLLAGAFAGGIQESMAQQAAGPSRDQQRALADVRELCDALDRYARRHDGEYPATLDSLVEPNDRGRTLLRRTELPLDPWGAPYRYEPPTASDPEPRVYTWGADGAPGGSGDALDIDADTVLPTGPADPFEAFIEALGEAFGD